MTFKERNDYNTCSKTKAGGNYRQMGANTVFYSSDDNYANISDEALIQMIKTGDQSALNYLLEKYKELVNVKVNRYFMVGAEREDIVQEGMIGLYKAIMNYETGKQSSFKSFANMCVERQLITAIKMSNRQKHMPLNSYLSLNTSAYENDEDTELIDVFNQKTMEDPLDTITKQEYYKKVEDTIDKSLSTFEKQVLQGYIQGESYVDIAAKLDAPVKSIDNAIQRIRKKAIKNMADDED